MDILASMSWAYGIWLDCFPLAVGTIFPESLDLDRPASVWAVRSGDRWLSGP